MWFLCLSDCCVHCILACLFCEFLMLCNIVLDCATCGSCSSDDSCFCCCCGSEECGDCELPCDMDCGIIDACCESADCLEICMECCGLCFSSWASCRGHCNVSSKLLERSSRWEMWSENSILGFKAGLPMRSMRNAATEVQLCFPEFGNWVPVYCA